MAKRLCLALAVCLFASTGWGQTQTFQFTTGTLGWNVDGHWSPPPFPNAVGASATFQNPTGAQTINLSAAITAGSLNFTNNTANIVTLANGTGGSLTLDAAGTGPATITVGGTSATTNNVTISATLSLTDSLTLNYTGTAPGGAAGVTLTGGMTGDGGFTKTGLGRVSSTSLTKAYAGATLIDQGRFRVTDAGRMTATSSIAVNSGGSLYLDSSGTAWNFGTTPANTLITINGAGDAGSGSTAATQGALRNESTGAVSLNNPVALGSDATIYQTSSTGSFTLNAPVSGSATLTKGGTGNLILNAANPSLIGGTRLDRGTLTANSGSNIGTGPLSMAPGPLGATTAVTLNNAAQTIGSLSSSFSTAPAASVQTITLNATALTINQTGVTTYGNGTATQTSTITGTGSVTLDSSSTGTLTLASPNTYQGGTAVNGGTLLVSNATGSGTGTGAVTVSTAGTIGGIGIIGGNLTVNDGTLAPGASPGTLTVNGALVLNSQSVLAYELNGGNEAVDDGTNDLVKGVTDLTLAGTLNVTETSSFLSAQENDAWRLVNYSGSLLGNSLAIGSMPALSSGLAFAIDATTAGQINLLVVAAAVPEASALAMLGLVGGLGTAVQVWRRRRSG